MRIEVWHQDWTRARGPHGGDGPAGSKREVAEHFQRGLYTKVAEVEVAGGEWHAAADAVWRRPTAACRPGDVLVAHKGGIARRAAFVLMRDHDGLRLQKIDMAKAGDEGAPEPLGLPAFITGASPRRQAAFASA